MEVAQTEWNKLQELFEAALALPAEQREDYLQQQDGNAALLQDVRDLLDAHLSADNLWQNSPSNPSQQRYDAGETVTLKSGHVIGPHQIQEKIGAGGMGVIYRALDTRLQRQVALKFLPNHMHSDDSARQRFLAEARAASRLDHPNICVIHDFGETEEGHLYITMPFYRGETLATKISRGPLSLQETIDIVIQAGDGLASAHDHDIVHRDIKPANIMLTQDGLVKILDFGVAKVANVNLTGSGVGVGTLAYMAPEQLNGELVDARADIWAVGATLFEMLTGKFAFPGKGLQQIIKSVFDEQYDPLADLPGHVSRELRLVLHHALQRDRNARYANMAEMLDQLIRARASLQDGDTARHQTAATRVKREDAGFEWDAEFLDAVTEMLLPWLGPITPKMVQRYAKVSANLDRLIEYLGDVLPDEAARKSFAEQIKVKAAVHTSPPAPRTVADNNADNYFELSPTQLATLEQLLLPELGPIAAILIRRMAINVTDWNALCNQLTQYFSNQDDANNFLSEVAGKDNN